MGLLVSKYFFFKFSKFFLLYKKQEENLRSTTNLNSSANMNSQQFELEAEALISLVNKLVSQIEDRLKGKFNSHVC